MPWRNGGGITHELATHTDDDGALLWRVSVADIARDGPFSLFPGFERQSALLAGRGFRLGDATVSAEHSIVEYPGDVASECILTDGPVRVLNVFAARGRIIAGLRWLRVRGEAEIGFEGCHGVAICGGGATNLTDATLQAGDSMRLDGPVAIFGSSTLLVVTLT